MEHLRASKDINWTVVDALDPSDIAITCILDLQRLLYPSTGHRDDPGSVFRWPANINTLTSSTEHLRPSDSDLWTFVDTQDSRITTLSSPSVSPHPNVTCAAQDHSVPPFKPSPPDE
ncbi:hypothetical protein DFH29DRAFT_1020598 [Suillus ampliporus]|nr:hypothetical protein DFH29DRAFT_1020598 [Suillus ampliporus]